MKKVPNHQTNNSQKTTLNYMFLHLNVDFNAACINTPINV